MSFQDPRVFPNLNKLKITHLKDPSPAGSKIIAIDQVNIDFCDNADIPFSFKACNTPQELIKWYNEHKCQHYFPEISPFITFKTIFPEKEFPIPSKFHKKSGISFKVGFD